MGKGAKRKRNHRTRRLIRLMGEQGDRCACCGFFWKNIRLRKDAYPPGRMPTIEHVIPRAAGGLNGWENQVATCFICNTAGLAQLILGIAHPDPCIGEKRLARIKMQYAHILQGVMA